MQPGPPLSPTNLASPLPMGRRCRRPLRQFGFHCLRNRWAVPPLLQRRPRRPNVTTPLPHLGSVVEVSLVDEQGPAPTSFSVSPKALLTFGPPEELARAAEIYPAPSPPSPIRTSSSSLGGGETTGTPRVAVTPSPAGGVPTGRPNEMLDYLNICTKTCVSVCMYRRCHVHLHASICA